MPSNLLAVSVSSILVLVLGAPASAATERGPVTSSSERTSLASVVVSAGGGTVASVPRRHGSTAMRFPAFAIGPSAPRAAVAVRSPANRDTLNPGTAAFTIGADVLLDARSTQKGSSDNGNNVIQRGLFHSRTQYKIQIDSGRASCRVKGRSGTTMVTSPTRIQAGRWYELACTRSAALVSLTVTSRTGSTSHPQTSTKRGPTGDLTPANGSVPLTVGAKLDDRGVFTSSADQFNGLIDNAYLRFGGRLVTVSVPADPAARITTATSLAVSDTRADRGGKVTFRGAVSPAGAIAGSSVRLKLKKRNGTIKRYGALALDPAGAFQSARITVRPGRYKAVFRNHPALQKSKAVLTYKAGRFRTP